MRLPPEALGQFYTIETTESDKTENELPAEIKHEKVEDQSPKPESVEPSSFLTWLKKDANKIQESTNKEDILDRFIENAPKLQRPEKGKTKR